MTEKPEILTPEQAALAVLRERFPEPWVIGFVEPPYYSDRLYAVAILPERRVPYEAVRVAGRLAPDALSTARSCIAAWDEATRREVWPCNCADLPALRARVAELEKERDEWKNGSLQVVDMTIHDRIAERDEARAQVRALREALEALCIDGVPGGWPDDDDKVPEGWEMWTLLLHGKEVEDTLDGQEAYRHLLKLVPALAATEPGKEGE